MSAVKSSLLYIDLASKLNEFLMNAQKQSDCLEAIWTVEGIHRGIYYEYWYSSYRHDLLKMHQNFYIHLTFFFYIHFMPLWLDNTCLQLSCSLSSMSIDWFCCVLPAECSCAFAVVLTSAVNLLNIDLYWKIDPFFFFLRVRLNLFN